MIANLIKSDLCRISKEKFMYILGAVCVGLVLITIGFFKIAIVLATSVSGIMMFDTGSIFVSSITNCILIFSIAISIFIGSDYKNNTMRFKLTRGSRRYEVYIGCMITSVIITVIFYIVTCLSSIFLTMIFFGAHEITADKIILMLLLLPLFLGISGVASCISLLTRSMQKGIIINILITQFLPTLIMLLSFSNNQTLHNVLMWIPYYSVNMLPQLQQIAAVTYAECIAGGILLFGFALTLGGIIFYKIDFK